MEGKSSFKVIDVDRGHSMGLLGRLKGGKCLTWVWTSLATHKASRAIGPSMEPRKREYSLCSLFFNQFILHEESKGSSPRQ